MLIGFRFFWSFFLVNILKFENKLVSLPQKIINNEMTWQKRTTNRFLADSSELKMITGTDFYAWDFGQAIPEYEKPALDPERDQSSGRLPCIYFLRSRRRVL